jgi:hypothetical protein
MAAHAEVSALDSAHKSLGDASFPCGFGFLFELTTPSSMMRFFHIAETPIATFPRYLSLFYRSFLCPSYKLRPKQSSLVSSCGFES